MFATLLVPLLRATFVVTDSEVFKGRTLYFRKAHWARVSAAASAALRAQVQLQPLTAAAAHTLLSRADRQLPASRVRFMPKRAGLRPIVNLSTRNFPTPQARGSKRGVGAAAAAPASAAAGVAAVTVATDDVAIGQTFAAAADCGAAAAIAVALLA